MAQRQGSIPERAIKAMEDELLEYLLRLPAGERRAAMDKLLKVIDGLLAEDNASSQLQPRLSPLLQTVRTASTISTRDK